MQVAHQNDHVTHAVIGGGDTIDFGISSSAEFFNILSSTLYKDQILAVAREVLCNAWDAHIEAGVTDKPVEITLTDNKIIVKDFGKGIHRDDIGPIYGTYGGSTKKNDGTQTGGFGLGCKAPFAYTDHFEVTSSHEGVKTIYNMSKSSAQAQGKPGIVPIASFPTTETGLTVSIRIKDRADFRRFESVVKTIAHNGDMNMKLNNELLGTLNFDVAKNNYLITKMSNLLTTDHRILIRYGNVIYPVDDVAQIGSQMDSIIHHLDRLNGNQRYEQYRIIFQALPHSIAVTPSRESLSMQDHTINSLNSLFKGFLDELSTNFNKVCDIQAEQMVIQAVNDVCIPDLLNREALLPGIKEAFEPVTISDMETMVKRYLTKQYPTGLAFRKTDITRRMKLMSQRGLLNRGLVQSFLRDLEEVSHLPDEYRTGRSSMHTTWLQKRILGPLAVKLTEAKLDHKKLYVLDCLDRNTPDRYNRTNYPPITPVVSAKPAHLFNVLPYLRNIVVVSVALNELADRCKYHDVFKTMGSHHGCLFYHAGKKLVEKEAALAFFKNVGMIVVDLTNPADTHAARIKKARSAEITRKPVKKGLVCLSSITLDTRPDRIDTRLSRKEESKRITNPEFVISIPVRQDLSSSQLDIYSQECSRYIVDLFGDKGGVTTNSAKHGTYLKKGVRNFEDYLIEKLCHHMSTSPAIQEYWACRPERLFEAHDVNSSLRRVIRLIYNSNETRKEFQLVNNLTTEDKKYLAIWEDHTMKYHRYSQVPPEITKVLNQLKAIPINPISEALITKFKNNPFISLMDITEFEELIIDKKTTKTQISKAFEIFINILKN